LARIWLIKILHKEVPAKPCVTLDSREDAKKVSLKCQEKKIWTINDFGSNQYNVLRVMFMLHKSMKDFITGFGGVKLRKCDQYGLVN
jgi:hypothetical protein